MGTEVMIQPSTASDMPDTMSSYSRASSPRRQQSNRLSVNVPILLPTQLTSQPVTRTLESPRLATFSAAIDSSPRMPASPTARHMPPIPVTDVVPEDAKPTDFLTLVAQQERKVLELREELAKAEKDLDKLKKKWANIEAQKKRTEVRNGPKQMDRLASDAESLSSEIDENKERERERKRQLLENRRITVAESEEAENAATVSTDAAVKIKRKGSKRVFEGRHTRTLSLLSPTPKDTARFAHPDENTPLSLLTSPATKLQSTLDDNSSINSPSERPNIARNPHSITGLLAENQFQLPQSFGKTYKDLANRHSLPPGMVSPEVLIKKGQEVVDGVRGGFWNFWEDMRMVTVGEEAVTGEGVDRVGRKEGGHVDRKRSKDRYLRTETSKPGKGELGKKKEDSFWNEFGLDTPKRPDPITAIGNIARQSTPTPSAERLHRKGHTDDKHKTSTDSTNPPDLLTDIGQEEEEWDAWESPISLRQKNINSNSLDEKASKTTTTSEAVNVSTTTQGNTSLQWPELTKLTPGRLTRTVSDLMREWNTESEPKPARPYADDTEEGTTGLGSHRAEDEPSKVGALQDAHLSL